MKRRIRLCVGIVVVALFLELLAHTSSPSRAAGVHAAGKRITISLARQRLRAWEGKRVVMVTAVTTGDTALATPVGRFVIFAKRSPYTFVSPWPRGSRYWYPTATVSFAMEFHGGGYFIHDAPWRSVYGRGSNSGNTPGTDYGGTHGCVNVPPAAARFLFYWAPLGTPVHIVR